jgi:hypothetical protein
MLAVAISTTPGTHDVVPSERPKLRDDEDIQFCSSRAAQLHPSTTDKHDLDASNTDH